MENIIFNDPGLPTSPTPPKKSCKMHGNSCIFKKTSGLFKNVRIPDFLDAPHAATYRFARSPARAALITLLSPSEDQMSRSHRLPPHRRGVASVARTPSWSSETSEIHWKTKGKPACAPGLSQVPWRFPAIGNSTPRRRCIAMREA